MTKRKKIDDGSNGWKDMLLKTKIEEYDRLVSAVAVAKETKEQKIEDIVSSSVMPEGTYYRWKRGTAEAIRAAIADVPWLGDRHHIGNFDLKQYIPQDEELTTPEDEAELSELQQKQKARDNAALTLRALKEHVPRNSTVMDGTNGEGVFLRDPETKELYTCILVDKYKNQVKNADKYEGVLSYECQAFLKYTTRRNVVMVFIWDPPYQSICGGHTILNCTFAKSDSRMKFNSNYGVQYHYTNDMINAMYLRGFHWADRVLHAGGAFFVKCMHVNDGFDQLQGVKMMADLYNFCVKKVYTLKSASSSRKDSFLLVIVRKRSRSSGSAKKTKTIQSLNDMYLSTAEANDHKRTIKRRINVKAAEAYVKAIETSLGNGQVWADACTRLLEGLTEQQQCNAYKDIQQDIIDSFNSFQTKDAEIRQQLVRKNNNTDWSWEGLQSLAHSSQTIFLNVKTVAGLLFEQHLILNNIRIEDTKSLGKKKELELQFIGTKQIALVNKESHISLSQNIQLLRNQKNEEEQRQNKAERRVRVEEEEQEQEQEKKKQKQKQTNMMNFFK